MLDVDKVRIRPVHDTSSPHRHALPVHDVTSMDVVLAVRTHVVPHRDLVAVPTCANATFNVALDPLTMSLPLRKIADLVRATAAVVALAYMMYRGLLWHIARIL